MMNGTPEKHSFSSSEEKRGKQRRWWRGAESKMEGKDRMVEVRGGESRRSEYIILLHSSTVTRRDVTRGSKWRCIDGGKLTFTVPLL